MVKIAELESPRETRLGGVSGWSLVSSFLVRIKDLAHAADDVTLTARAERHGLNHDTLIARRSKIKFPLAKKLMIISRNFEHKRSYCRSVISHVPGRVLLTSFCRTSAVV